MKAHAFGRHAPGRVEQTAAHDPPVALALHARLPVGQFSLVPEIVQDRPQASPRRRRLSTFIVDRIFGVRFGGRRAIARLTLQRETQPQVYVACQRILANGRA